MENKKNVFVYNGIEFSCLKFDASGKLVMPDVVSEVM